MIVRRAMVIWAFPRSDVRFWSVCVDAEKRQAAGRKSLLFLKKKKQKNFCDMAYGSGQSRLQTNDVFLLLFLQKKKTLPVPRLFPVA
jgi:hypothetical protein